MSYQQLSGSDLPAGIRTDVDRQGPAGLPQSAFGSINTPAAESIHKRPNYIFINATGTFAFFYETTASIGTSVGPVAAQWQTGSVLEDASGPVRFDIQPVAWRKTSHAAGTQTAGDVTFVYQGGL